SASRPPVSPLFPYTTLFRSDHVAVVVQRQSVGAFRRCKTWNREVGQGAQESATVNDNRVGGLHRVAGKEPMPHGRRVGNRPPVQDRKSTRLNSSHLGISYAV